MIFCYLTANYQLKCGIIYKKIAMRAGDDERRINYEWQGISKGISLIKYQIFNVKLFSFVWKFFRETTVKKKRDLGFSFFN